MSRPQDPYANRGPVEVTSVATAIKFSPPMPWIQIRAAGSGGLVVKSEDGTSRTFTNLLAGDVLRGPFSELTSMTVTRLWYGDGEPPTNTAPIPTAIPPTWTVAPVQTTGFSAAIDTLYPLTVTSAVTAQLPALAGAIDGHRVAFFNNATSAAVVTPTGSDLLAVSGGAGATGATAAGPTGGNMQTWVAMASLGKWVKWG